MMKKKLEFEEQRMAIVSTSHLTEKDGELIVSPDMSCVVAQTDYGTILHTGWNTKGCGLSAHFKRIIKEVTAQGFDYVYFDRDGEIVEGLKTFYW